MAGESEWDTTPDPHPKLIHNRARLAPTVNNTFTKISKDDGYPRLPGRHKTSTTNYRCEANCSKVKSRMQLLWYPGCLKKARTVNGQGDGEHVTEPLPTSVRNAAT